MTNTFTTALFAALLRDVPIQGRANTDGTGLHELVFLKDVLAALTLPGDEAGKVLEGVTQGRVVQFHPHYCAEAKGAAVSDWDTSHDLSVIRPDGTRYRIGSMRHADDAAFFQWCHTNLPALLAARAADAERIRELEAELSVCSSQRN